VKYTKPKGAHNQHKSVRLDLKSSYKQTSHPTIKTTKQHKTS